MTKSRQWTMIAGLLAVVLLAGGWFMLISPKRSNAAEIRSQAVSEQQAIAGLRSKLQVLKAQAADLPAQQARLAAISTLIPDNPALPALIRQLTAAGEKAGIVLDSVAPAAPASAATTAAGSAGAGQPATAPLQAIQLTLNSYGSYYDQEAFLANLEDLDRALRVTGFSVTPGKAPKASSSHAGSGSAGSSDRYDGSLKMSITADVYLSSGTLPGSVTSAAVQPAVAATPTPSATPAK